MTLKEWTELEGRKWKEVERDLTEILASYDEPPMYANRLNRLRRDGKAKSAEIRALLELTSNLVDGYKDGGHE